jgi:hypothetical protein
MLRIYICWRYARNFTQDFRPLNFLVLLWSSNQELFVFLIWKVWDSLWELLFLVLQGSGARGQERVHRCVRVRPFRPSYSPFYNNLVYCDRQTSCYRRIYRYLMWYRKERLMRYGPTLWPWKAPTCSYTSRMQVQGPERELIIDLLPVSILRIHGDSCLNGLVRRKEFCLNCLILPSIDSWAKH